MNGEVNIGAVLALVAAFLGSFQFKTILGLIFVDVVFGIAQAVRAKEFEWGRVADFYLSNVLPYVLCYGSLYVGIYVILPKEFGLLPDSLVTVAWGTLVSNLLSSITKNLFLLFPQLSGKNLRL